MKRREFLQKAGLGALGAAVVRNAIAENTSTPTATTTSPLSSSSAGPPLRWGLIGTGNRCLHLISALNQVPGNRIIAACDIRPERLERAVKRMKEKPLATFADYRELLKRDDLDAIMIATPNHLHSEETIAAFARGFHVFSEKPMGITVDQCNAMMAAQEKSGKVLQLGLELRYSSMYQKVYDLLQNGALGKLKFIWFNEFRGDWVKQSNDPEEDNRINWRYYKKYSGGTLLEKSCHYFDLFNWFIGTPALSVTGMGGVNFYTNGRDTLDHASVVVDYEGDVKATHGLAMYSPKLHRFTLVGEKGMMDLQLDSNSILLHRGNGEPETISVVQGARDAAGHQGTKEQIMDFRDCVRSGKKPLCDGKIGKESIRVGLAGELAIEHKRLVRMSEVPA